MFEAISVENDALSLPFNLWMDFFWFYLGTRFNFTVEESFVELFWLTNMCASAR